MCENSEALLWNLFKGWVKAYICWLNSEEKWIYYICVSLKTNTITTLFTNLLCSSRKEKKWKDNFMQLKMYTKESLWTYKIYIFIN